MVDFLDPAGPMSSVMLPRSGPAPNSESSAVTPLLIRSRVNGLAMLGCDKAGKYEESSSSNREIMVAAAKTGSTKLHDPQPASFSAHAIWSATPTGRNARANKRMGSGTGIRGLSDLTDWRRVQLPVVRTTHHGRQTIIVRRAEISIEQSAEARHGK
jgi:hypothetical protein